MNVKFPESNSKKGNNKNSMYFLQWFNNPNFNLKLDSMHLFSNRCSHQTTQLFTYLLMDSVPRPHLIVYFLQSDSAIGHILGCGALG